MDLDARVTVPTIRQAMPHISRQLIRWWVGRGYLTPVDSVGRLPRYRWGDVITVERDLRLSPLSSRSNARRRSVPA